MANGSSLQFYKALNIACKVRDIALTEEFVAGKLQEDAILGIPFLTRQGCTMKFGQPTIPIGEITLSCTYRHGRPLVSPLQVIHRVTLQPRVETLLQCQATAKKVGTVRLVEGKLVGLGIVSSIN